MMSLMDYCILKLMGDDRDKKKKKNPNDCREHVGGDDRGDEAVICWYMTETL